MATDLHHQPSPDQAWTGQTPSPARRGPKPRLSTKALAAAAVALADEEGLAAVAMRPVAARLGVGAMTLYTYVPSKAELIELMFDHVYGEPLPDFSPTAPPRDRLAALARADRAIQLRHPWLLEISDAVYGPNRTTRHEQGFRAMDGLELSGLEKSQALDLLDAYVAGVVRAASPDPDRGFEFGLAPILDGIDALIAARSA